MHLEATIESKSSDGHATDLPCKQGDLKQDNSEEQR